MFQIGTSEQLPDMSVSCSEFYEPEALMMEEEGMVIVGLLVGLNVLDANLCLKGEDLDSQVIRNLGSDGINQASSVFYMKSTDILNLRKGQKAGALCWKLGQAAMVGLSQGRVKREHRQSQEWSSIGKVPV